MAAAIPDEIVEAQIIGNPISVAETVEFTPVPTADQDGTGRLWPVALPELVVEVRNVSWSCGVVCHVLEFSTFLAVPWSEPRRWLENLPYSIPWVFVFCGWLALAWWLLITCHKDPGYLTPTVAGPEDDTVPEQEEPDQEQQSLQQQDDKGTLFGEIIVPLHWCSTCQLLQPRRTKHCKECGFCVRTFDHHCFWIGGCVGEYNHKHFLCMLTVWTGMLLWHGCLLVACRDSRPVNPMVWCSRNWWVVVVVVGLLVHLVLIGGLWVYHLFLVATGQTTWEHLCRSDIDYLQPFPREVFPFSRGVRGNCADFLRRQRGAPPREWAFTWQPGQPVPFNAFENQYWSCC